MDLLVGTFGTPYIFSLRFTPPKGDILSTPASTSRPRGSLEILTTNAAIGAHSWLALSPSKEHLYASVWLEPPSIAAYKVNTGTTGPTVKLLNNKPIVSRSGYVCASSSHIFSAGGSSGDVFSVAADGSVGDHVQTLAFADTNTDAQATAPGDFGGLRHGAHSVDLSPDGKSLYIADIGRNCVWTYSVSDLNSRAEGVDILKLGEKHVASRENDGPRHTTPHPNGSKLYVINEHSSTVDVFSVAQDGVTLELLQSLKAIPSSKDAKDYWADELRVSTDRDHKYLYASTRGLEAQTLGYVAAYALDTQGLIVGEALCIWETPTSGGIANAIEPAPATGEESGINWIALTDSEQGCVSVLGFDGRSIWEEARCTLVVAEEGNDEIQDAATAVWL